ncbi:hypothetical protein BPA30113_04929 [Burkholderia paludis]|uniref:Uncharacterized protein n=1 Tax=Burkholderia paludis TaxID=1506587 RepID=A0A6J5E1J5_9BURK|nr:hypothetical protein LMG30113_03655 [Burkholderia paludis]VWC04954.1 hypothetical protein BPA30113_04929 [Burkholderia paludis]
MPPHRIHRAIFLDHVIQISASHREIFTIRRMTSSGNAFVECPKFSLPAYRFFMHCRLPESRESRRSKLNGYRMPRDATAASRPNTRRASKESPPAARRRVPAHRAGPTFSRAEKTFSRTDGLYIHACRYKSDYLRTTKTRFQPAARFFIALHIDRINPSMHGKTHPLPSKPGPNTTNPTTKTGFIKQIRHVFPRRFFPAAHCGHQRAAPHRASPREPHGILAAGAITGI